jgi:hypothetical protein
MWRTHIPALPIIPPVEETQLPPLQETTMNQQKRDESGLKNLSEEELEIVRKGAEFEVVEAEITTLSRRLLLAVATEEKEFRTSGKPKRPAEDWRRQWFDGVTEIAAAHRLDPTIVWEVARKVEAMSDRDFRSRFGQT